jgi:redox-sensitive bicupin YhaK (pirin superfamily)
MLLIRKSGERGLTRLDWLDSRHTFSFGEYYDPAAMGFSVLRVINDDVVAPGAGFPTHPHRDMEIITWVLSGALEHRDSLGNGSLIRPGDAQRMTAGTGIMHSEFNPSPDEPVRLLQIWILPDCQGLRPGYEQHNFTEADRRGRLCQIVSPDGAEGSITIHQDARVYASLLDAGAFIEQSLRPGRRAWLHIARGAVRANGTGLSEGDGAALEGEARIAIEGVEDSEVLLFDLR